MKLKTTRPKCWKYDFSHNARCLRSVSHMPQIKPGNLALIFHSRMWLKENFWCQ